MLEPSSGCDVEIATAYHAETHNNGPELDMSIQCSVASRVECTNHTLNITLMESRRGSSTLAAGIRLYGHDISVWYKVRQLA